MALFWPTRRTDTAPVKAEARYPALVVASLVFVALIFIVFLFADILAPYDYRTQSLINRLKPPVFLGGTWAHVLGTDELGRDVLSRLIYAIRFSVLVALGGTMIGAFIGTLLGFLAAHFRGWVEEAIMMMADVQASLPFMLIALALIALFGGSFTLFIVIMGFYGWEVFARLTRGVVIAANTQGYAMAVVALGAPAWHVYARHILPNILSVLIVQFTLNFPQVILLETSLSFLGLGIRPPLTSLGQMLGAGRAYLMTAWWIAILPGMAIFLTTMSISILGDWVRDRLDPTLKSG
ncbi:MAG: ABC transporter permease [Chelatococcus sp.]|jgi:peptide/nickel transport system permease protein|uniref:ABC transporter permease n=1 Tax=unclassified Chelatococcus TaxID=2638111 RepID=UPI001BCC3F39|nr:MULTISPECIES: ABC transporter permease [unclassified Chelatococcus]CAH1670903.1 Peptide/nickel transport system permease protein [Hyphomicrobiales bacterium]MBS7739142.1 ABC transporter permease [Chelatococcus sp. HY11]MBX3536938.1 ABC transporter permease [Chelatococcus sp.]MBX3543632.1 ABC transporter permease [Chelatococcus sp.]MCO5076326.1 ABC transporter permease [Chelatococcus sp.]